MFYVWDFLGEFEPLHDQNLMISAGSAWVNPDDGFSMYLPPRERVFVDSGGYQVSANWQGKYPYTVEEYLDWAERIGADFVAGMDYACEKNICDIPVDLRMKKTVGKQLEQKEVMEERHHSFEMIPVIQGRNIEQYLECYDLLQDHSLVSDYIAIGTLCERRAPKKIINILGSICEHVPNSTSFHLFGVKISVLERREAWHLLDRRVRSMDTAAWTHFSGSSKVDGQRFASNREQLKLAFSRYDEKVQEYLKAMDEQATIDVGDSGEEERVRTSF